MMQKTTEENFLLLGRLFSQFVFSERRTIERVNCPSRYIANCLTDMISDMNKHQSTCIDWCVADECGKTLAFYILNAYPHPITLAALMLLKVDIQHTDEQGNTLLHQLCACSESLNSEMSTLGKQTAQCIKNLCQYLDINACNNMGETPIFMLRHITPICSTSPSTDFRAAVDAMIECGADIFKQDNAGKYFTEFCNYECTSELIISCLENERMAVQRHMLHTASIDTHQKSETKVRKI